MEDGSTVTISVGTKEKGDRFVELSNMKGIYKTLSSAIDKAVVSLDEIREEPQPVSPEQ